MSSFWARWSKNGKCTQVFVSHENKLVVTNFPAWLVKNVLFAVCPAFANIRGFGGEYANIVHQQIQNPFGAQVLMRYKRFCAKCQPECFTVFIRAYIHYNSHIVRDKKTFHDRRLSENCVTMVKHLMDEEGNILSFADFLERFPNVGLDFLTCHGLVLSVMTYQKEKGKLWVRIVFSLLIQTQNHGQLFWNGAQEECTQF